MKKFLLNTFFFSLLILISICLAIALTHLRINNKADFKFADKTQSVILGHSHSECAFNDSIIEGVKNFSYSGDSYFYIYFKFLQIHQQNPEIKKVFVEFSNNQVSDSLDKWIWADRFLSSRYPVWGPFMNAEANTLLATKNTGGFINGTSNSLKQNFVRVFKNDYDFKREMGGYVFSDRSKTDSLLDAKGKHRQTHFNYSNRSDQNIFYLHKLVKYCTDNHITVFFVRSPLHKDSDELSNEKIFLSVKDSDFAAIELLDFKNFPIANNEFGDLEHLNYKGAGKFSNFFNELLKKGLLEKNNKQLFIEREMSFLN